MGVLHVVGLGSVGGLERLFAAYLAATHNHADPPAVAVKAEVHPRFEDVLAAHPGTVFRQQYLGPLRLHGKPLRALNRRRILARVRPHTVVFWSSFPDAAWRRACRRRGARVVYYDHGRSWHVDATAGGAILADCDAVIAVSRAGARVVVERLGYRGPLSVAPNAVLVELTTTAARSNQAALRIGFAGRLVDKKGVAVLLHAIARLADQGVPCRLDVAGDGPAREALEALSRRLGIDTRVRFLGLQGDLGGFYDGIDVAVVPSVQEPFGLAALEAAARGVPVVAARVDGLAEVVRHGVSGETLVPRLDMSAYAGLGGGPDQIPPYVYDPDTDRLVAPRALDPEELADCLKALAADPDRCRMLGLGAREDVRQRFSFDSYMRALDSAVRAPGGG